MDTIGELVKDYLGTTLPEVTRTLRLEFSAQQGGMLAIVYDGPEIPENAPDIRADFHMKRMYTVGGN